MKLHEALKLSSLMCVKVVDFSRFGMYTATPAGQCWYHAEQILSGVLWKLIWLHAGLPMLRIRQSTLFTRSHDTHPVSHAEENHEAKRTDTDRQDYYWYETHSQLSDSVHFITKFNNKYGFGACKCDVTDLCIAWTDHLLLFTTS